MYKRKNPPSLRGKLIKKLDRIFSEFIRRRDADERGICKCISCGKSDHWKNMDCGHFENRRILSLRFDEKNCNAQCRFCNRFREGMKDTYKENLIKKYGPKVIDYLNSKKNNQCKLYEHELRFFISWYKKKVDDGQHKGIDEIV